MSDIQQFFLQRDCLFVVFFIKFGDKYPLAMVSHICFYSYLSNIYSCMYLATSIRDQGNFIFKFLFRLLS